MSQISLQPQISAKASTIRAEFVHPNDLKLATIISTMRIKIAQIFR